MIVQEMDDAGFHRLVFGDLKGEWYGYDAIAVLQVSPLMTYYGTTQYWAGKFPFSVFHVAGVQSTWKDFGPREDI